MCDGKPHDQKAHIPFLAIWQFMTCLQLVHDLFNEHMSPTIMQSDQTTCQTIANTHQQYCLGKTILP